MHLGALCAPHGVIGMKMMPPSGRATLAYTLSKFEVNLTDSS